MPVRLPYRNHLGGPTICMSCVPLVHQIRKHSTGLPQSPGRLGYDDPSCRDKLFLPSFSIGGGTLNPKTRIESMFHRKLDIASKQVVHAILCFCFRCTMRNESAITGKCIDNAASRSIMALCVKRSHISIPLSFALPDANACCDYSPESFMSSSPLEPVYYYYYYDDVNGKDGILA